MDEKVEKSHKIVVVSPFVTLTLWNCRTFNSESIWIHAGPPIIHFALSVRSKKNPKKSQKNAPWEKKIPFKGTK